MSNEKIQDLLAKLHGEMDTTEIDEETRSLIQELDSDIRNLLNSAVGETDSNSAFDRAKLLETKFATSHPAAEHFIREIVDALARMGV